MKAFLASLLLLTPAASARVAHFFPNPSRTIASSSFNPLSDPEPNCNSLANPFPRMLTSSSIPRSYPTPRNHAALCLLLAAEPPPPYKSGRAEAEYEGVEPQNPNVVLALDYYWAGTAIPMDVSSAAIGVTILFAVFTNAWVGEPKRRNVNKGHVAE